MRKRAYRFMNVVIEWLNRSAELEAYGSNALVMYEKGVDFDVITVDDSMINEDYCWYASIHECICCGAYQFMAPEVEDPLDRCGMIDVMILDWMLPEERRNYLEKRIEMFEALIEKNLNPALTEQFEHSLAILENYEVTDKWRR